MVHLRLQSADPIWLDQSMYTCQDERTGRLREAVQMKRLGKTKNKFRFFIFVTLFDMHALESFRQVKV